MRNIRMTIEYDGTGFSGWQRQPDGVKTVQGVLEETLGRILQEHVRLTGAGRTDSGVHAKGQAAHFRTASGISVYRLVHAVNCLLPPSVRVCTMSDAADDFHARFDAVAREYRYFFAEKPSVFHRRYAACSNGPLDPEQLNRCARELVGTHDFSAFSREDPERDNTRCTVYGASWQKLDELTVFRITADRFLRTMVRFLVSAQRTAVPGELAEALRTGRTAQKITPADPAGLFLWRVVY